MLLAYAAWETWSAAADKTENGWQSDFPAWNGLIALAIAAMTEDEPSLHTLRVVEACWLISEETQDLADYAAAHMDECWTTVAFLARFAFNDVRWQVYAVLASAGARAEPLLRVGLDDPHPYSRRRAILSLSRHHPPDADQPAERFVGDADAYIRLAAIEMIRTSSHTGFIRSMKDRLLGDRVDFVRAAASTLTPIERLLESPSDPARRLP